MPPEPTPPAWPPPATPPVAGPVPPVAWPPLPIWPPVPTPPLPVRPPLEDMPPVARPPVPWPPDPMPPVPSFPPVPLPPAPDRPAPPEPPLPPVPRIPPVPAPAPPEPAPASLACCPPLPPGSPDESWQASPGRKTAITIAVTALRATVLISRNDDNEHLLEKQARHTDRNQPRPTGIVQSMYRLERGSRQLRETGSAAATRSGPAMKSFSRASDIREAGGFVRGRLSGFRDDAPGMVTRKQNHPDVERSYPAVATIHLTLNDPRFRSLTAICMFVIDNQIDRWHW